MLKMTAILLLVAAVVGLARADTPANCSYEDVRGTWVFHEGPRGNDKTINCSATANLTSSFVVHLDFPNVATDDQGNVGFWTIIYNQGFEVVLNHRKYFAFSLYQQQGDQVISYCNHTWFGWAHSTGVNPSDWSCYIGLKSNSQDTKPKVARHPIQRHLEATQSKRLYKTNPSMIAKINSIQKSWRATHYPHMHNKMTVSDVIRMAGGVKSRIVNIPKPAPVSEEVQMIADALPAAFDWRNVSGETFTSPVRNQGSCGSCYAFASMAMNEARLRVKTMNRNQTVFSTQDIVECAEYAQGCDGGFPYLISGKYAEDFGLVEESCNPYKGQDGQCSTQSTCPRTYSTRYHYVGGFYGACNEALMKIELVKNGPMAVSFMVYDDFLAYSGGIYHHTFTKDQLNFGFSPFELTNHAVLLVGYGTDQATGQDYWIVKNSWGTSWGEDGFFRIRRGTDECSIESIAVGSDIIV